MMTKSFKMHSTHLRKTILQDGKTNLYTTSSEVKKSRSNIRLKPFATRRPHKRFFVSDLVFYISIFAVVTVPFVLAYLFTDGGMTMNHRSLVANETNMKTGAYALNMNMKHSDEVKKNRYSDVFARKNYWKENIITFFRDGTLPQTYRKELEELVGKDPKTGVTGNCFDLTNSEFEERIKVVGKKCGERYLKIWKGLSPVLESGEYQVINRIVGSEVKMSHKFHETEAYPLEVARHAIFILQLLPKLAHFIDFSPKSVVGKARRELIVQCLLGERVYIDGEDYSRSWEPKQQKRPRSPKGQEPPKAKRQKIPPQEEKRREPVPPANSSSSDSSPEQIVPVVQTPNKITIRFLPDSKFATKHGIIFRKHKPMTVLDFARAKVRKDIVQEFAENTMARFEERLETNPNYAGRFHNSNLESVYIEICPEDADWYCTECDSTGKDKSDEKCRICGGQGFLDYESGKKTNCLYPKRNETFRWKDLMGREESTLDSRV